MTWQPALDICPNQLEVSVSKTQLTHQSHHWSITHDHQGMETPKWTSRDEQIKKAWGVIQLFHGPLLWPTFPPPCPLWSNGAVNDYTPDYTNKGEPVILGLPSCPSVATPSMYRQGCQEVKRHSPHFYHQPTMPSIPKPSSRKWTTFSLS